MEFDKSRVYTALNADELEVGSTVFVANTLAFFKEVVNDEQSDRRVKVDRIESECYESRFHANSENWQLAYLISPPKKPEYKPFSDTETAYKTITAHGGWIKEKSKKELRFIFGIDMNDKDFQIHTNCGWCSVKDVLEDCVFADDGTPVGVKVEDDDSDAE
ncbi:MAG: hypothetical protein ACFNX0_00130 [Treponema sp.]